MILSESKSLLGTMFLINVSYSRVWVLFMLEAYGRTVTHSPLFLQYFNVYRSSELGLAKGAELARHMLLLPKRVGQVKVILKQRLKT